MHVTSPRPYGEYYAIRIAGTLPFKCSSQLNRVPFWANSISLSLFTGKRRHNFCCHQRNRINYLLLDYCLFDASVHFSEQQHWTISSTLLRFTSKSRQRSILLYPSSLTVFFAEVFPTSFPFASVVVQWNKLHPWAEGKNQRSRTKKVALAICETSELHPIKMMCFSFIDSEDAFEKNHLFALLHSICESSGSRYTGCA